MKKIFYSTFVFTTLLFSCSDYLDSPNEDFTNNPESEGISPAQKLAGAQLNLLNNEVINYNVYGNRMTYAYGLNSGFTSSDAAYNFNFNSDTYTVGTWDNAYLYMDNLQDIIDTEAQFPEYLNHVAIAKVLKAQGMEKIVSLYGDAPYSEAFKSKEGITKPVFDDDKQIIMDLFDLLDEARQNISDASSDASILVPGGEDIVFNGDMAKWTQYANTLELRLLLRLSDTSDSDLVTLRTNRFATLTNDFITEDVTFNPGFTGATAAQSNPMFRVYGTNVAQTAWTQSNRSNAAGDFIAQVINGTLNTPTLVTTGVVDPRRARMFTTISGTVQGAVQGTETTIAKSRLAGYVHGYVNSGLGDQYENGTERDAYVMLASESYFLQAEAAQRGYISGDAQTLFNQAITESFAFYSAGFGGTVGLYAPLNAASYIAAIDSKVGLGWTATPDKINCIITQKWLALSQWTGIEPYFDFMRTGYPAVPLPSGVTQTSRPNRLIYPSSEYSSNSANTPSVSVSDLFTVNSKTPVYLQ